MKPAAAPSRGGKRPTAKGTTKAGGSAPRASGSLSLKTAYARGGAFERKVQDHLQARGYSVGKVARSLGTYDLVAVRSVARGDVLFVQCKSDGRLDPAPWNDLFCEALARGAQPVLARRGRKRGSLRYQILMACKVRGAGAKGKCLEWEP